MALGSSAPEILLSVVGTVRDIEALPSKLGPSTIVGSAAFNLMVISGVSILAVGETPKKINVLGVFAVTSIFSLFAYVWLYLTLMEFNSPNVIETWEAWLTLLFMVILLAMAYCADYINGKIEDKKKSIEEKENADRQANISSKKQRLRSIAKEKTQLVVI
jgi:solute carrier family 8 (sodium/calcium exchanger)